MVFVGEVGIDPLEFLVDTPSYKYVWHPSQIIPSQTWRSAAFPYIKVTRKAAKNLSFKSAPTNAFNSTNLFLFFSYYHVPTNNVAPSFGTVHTTHNSSIRSEEGLTLETTALNLFTVANLYYQLS